MSLEINVLQPTIEVDIAGRFIEVEMSGGRGPPGGSGITDYVHTQVAPSAVWTINHNLGRYVIVTLLSVGSVEIEGSVTHPSMNQVQVTFAIPVAGVARVI